MGALWVKFFFPAKIGLISQVGALWVKKIWVKKQRKTPFFVYFGCDRCCRVVGLEKCEKCVTEKNYKEEEKTKKNKREQQKREKKKTKR